MSAEQWDVEWFVRMNNTGGPVDVWQVDGVDAAAMVGNGNGYFYFPGRIHVDRLILLQRDLAGGDLHQA